jgi:hypothetical protein
MISCAKNALHMLNGGNMWSSWPAWLSFFRHVVKLDLPIYKKFQHYEAAAIHGGFRIMHEDFCMISDRPRVLKIDEDRRPHCEDGPSHLWSDGFAIFYWHGYRIEPGKTWIITDKDRLSPNLIDAEPNAELRRIMLEIYGFERYTAARGAKVIDEDVNHGQPRRLMSMKVMGEEIRVLHVINGSLEPDGTRRQFHIGAVRNPRTREQAKTVHEAVALSYGEDPATYREDVRT